jgi:hypothetical protein
LEHDLDTCLFSRRYSAFEIFNGESQVRVVIAGGVGLCLMVVLVSGESGLSLVYNVAWVVAPEEERKWRLV